MSGLLAYEPFDANRFPLTPGRRLLEASAGTGKTFALAQLVLRLVAEAAIPLRRILVVTYTEAAAAELRDRIGRRLQQGLACLEDPDLPPPDAVLADWLAPLRTAAGTGPDPLRGRLLLALEELDAADITTIHGFCRRTLQRQALEAGSSPELQLESDGAALIEQVVHDHWQRLLLPLPPHLLAGLQRQGLSPQALARDVLTRLDGDPALRLDAPPPDLPWSEPLPQWLPELWQERWQRFVALWHEEGRMLQEDLQAMAAQWKALGLGPSRIYSPGARKDRCQEIDDWIGSQPEGGSYEAALEQKLLRGYYHPGVFCREARPIEAPGDGTVRLPRPRLMRAIADLLDGPAELVLLHAAHHGQAELRRRRERSGVTTFSQLLAALDPGPDASDPGPLLTAVGERYGAALIDEFQDTDPIQWRILGQAFGGGRHPLVMVGDPKQAIYRFRGGDLDTYLAAREQADALYELSENRRSTEALIGALNGLMAPGLRRSGLAVPSVQACARCSGPAAPQAPIELLWLGENPEQVPAKTELEAQLPPRIAALVLELLERGLELDAGDGPVPLRPDDLCLLVNSHRQAEALRAALERQGLASRLVSRADVFASPAATALQRLLDALADPADGNRLGLLAASPLLAWSPAQLAAREGREISRLAGRLARLSGQLPQRGLLGVLADLVDDERLASLALGGRLLADLQQVAALVQERIHADQLGPEAAADWLRRLRLDPDRTPPEEHQAHSDRADGAVSVVTVHRSKGLEYPVVICPYLWSSASAASAPGARGGGNRRIGRRWHPPGAADPHLDLHLQLDWGQGHAALQQERQAEEQERERLAYVAVTRARHLLVLAWGPAKGHHAAPLVPWLFDEEAPRELDGTFLEDRPPPYWRERLEQQIAARGLPVTLREAPAPLERRWQPPGAGGGPLACGPVPRQQDLDDLWGRSSYTSWTRTAHTGSAPVLPDEGRDTLDPSLEDLEPSPDMESAPEPDTAPDGEGPLGRFPRGAAAGDCLHRILERIELQLPLEEAANRDVVKAELERAGLGNEPIEPVLAGLERTRLSPFGGALGSLRVADLPADGRLSEMNFDLSLSLVRAGDLARAFRDHPGGPFGADYAAALAALPIASRGFLTGSIDLVFREPAAPGGDPEGGRWWVLDWKSNWLGRRDAEGQPLSCGPRDYGRAAMERLMASHHYPLQAHLYLVALHRYLRWRLPGYAPETHLGGYAYVFLRGNPGAMPAGAAGGPGAAVPGMLVERPPLERLLALDVALGRPGAPEVR